MSIDTIRLRALHTKCLPVCDIADKLGTTPTIVESELAKLGLKPNDPTSFTVEPNEIISEHNKKNAPETVAAVTSAKKGVVKNSSQPIIHQNSEPVKRFSDATLDAISDGIARKKIRIEYLEEEMFAKYQAIEKINEEISELGCKINRLYDDVRHMEADKGAMI